VILGAQHIFAQGLRGRVGRIIENLKERIRPVYQRKVYFRICPSRVPEYFRQCWQYPSFDGTAETLEDGVVFLPMGDWHARLQRSQWLALQMGEIGYRVLYLSPHLGREFPELYERSKTVEIRSLAKNVWEAHVRLAREPVFHHRLLSEDESAILSDGLAEATSRLGMRNAVQILSFPVWGKAALMLRERMGWPLVYDCHDYIAGFSRIARTIADEEPEMIGKADLAMFSSATLMQRHENVCSKPLLMRNGVDSSFFCEGTPLVGRDVDPTVTYVGALDDWFDAEAIKAAAVRFPSITINLVGRVESPVIRRLERFPNVQLLGEWHHANIIRILRQTTVAVIPFRLNKLTRAVDPIKAYEYLALGLPVVSADLPEIARFRELVYLYRSSTEFCASLAAALAEDDEDLRRKRRLTMQPETWAARARVLSQHIGRIRPGSHQ